MHRHHCGTGGDFASHFCVWIADTWTRNERSVWGRLGGSLRHSLRDELCKQSFHRPKMCKCRCDNRVNRLLEMPWEDAQLRMSTTMENVVVKWWRQIRPTRMRGQPVDLLLVVRKMYMPWDESDGLQERVFLHESAIGMI